jgi:hypothetical protein
MGFKKKIRSKKAVDINYWRLVSAYLTESGALRMRVAGYKDGESYAGKADPIDEYECVISNASTGFKAPFYDLLEQYFPIFAGAEKDLTYSEQSQGRQTVTVMNPRGDIIMQKPVEEEEQPPEDTSIDFEASSLEIAKEPAE